MSCDGIVRADSSEYLLQSGDFPHTYGGTDKSTTKPTSTCLQEVVVSQVSKTAFDLFGKVYTDLTDKHVSKRRITHGFFAISVTSGLTGAGIFMYGLITGHANFVMGGVCSLVGAAFSVSIPAYNIFFYEQKVDAFLKGCDTITNFYNDFEEFKKDPQEFKVSPVLTSFDKIHKNNCFKYLLRNDSDIFHSTGKLFVLDAAIKLIKEKNLNSQIAEKWDTVINDPEKPKSQALNAEIWKSLNIEQPGNNHFFLLSKICQEKDGEPQKAALKIANRFKWIISQLIAQEFM